MCPGPGMHRSSGGLWVLFRPWARLQNLAPADDLQASQDCWKLECMHWLRSLRAAALVVLTRTHTNTTPTGSCESFAAVH